MNKFLEYREANWLIWLKAMRPKTLTASICPVLIGGAVAFQHGFFKFTPAIICLLFAVLVQIGTNFANEYFDFLKGADNEDRKGPRRAVAAGLIKPVHMLYATMGVLLAAFLVGLILLYYGDWWLIGVGIASLMCAILYTAGPFALAYKGLGDVFVIFFFGVVAVNCTYYVQTGFFNWEVFGLSIVMGLLVNNILVVANFRDFEEDRKVGKMTLIARFGREFGIWEYKISLVIVYLILTLLAVRGAGTWVLFPFAITIRAFHLPREMKEAQTLKDHLNLLAQTSSFLMLFTLCLLAGIVIQSFCRA